MKDALVLVDIQKDYFPGGKYELFQAEQALAKAKQLLAWYRQQEQPVFFIQHINEQQGAAFFEIDTDGVKIHDQITPQDFEMVVIKRYPDSFLQTELDEQLQKQKITHLTVAGMMSHMCIDTTVRSAAAKGYQVTVIEDACATRSLQWKENLYHAALVHEVFMSALQGKFAGVITAEQKINRKK